MVKKWFHIAKADFYVLTAGMRNHRRLYSGVFCALGIVWAVYGAPFLIGGALNAIMPMSDIQALLMIMFPGLMRSAMMVLWIMLLLFPMGKALEEIKIGHWEIFLSNNVKTRDILTGGFLGGLPLYGLLTLFLAPLIITPFILAFEVSLIGVALMYTVLILTVLTVLWISNFVTAAVKSKLGDSSRGDDIAKALSFVIAFAGIMPIYGLIFAAPMMTEILGTDVFLLLPFTWSADVVSWIAITFNGIGLTESEVAFFGTILQFDLLVSTLLTGVFSVVVLGLTLGAAGRVFTITAGARTERIITVGRENFILRVLRKLTSDSFGALLVVNMKDYFRKAQNLSKMFYGVILAIVLPLIMTLFTDFVVGKDLVQIISMFGMMFAMVGAFPFVGAGFLESKDQLWIIQSAPRGASRFVKARLVMAVIADVFLTLIVVVGLTFILGLGAVDALLLLGYGLMVVIGSSMVAIGVTARNPNYEDTKSPAHQANMMMAIMIPMSTMIGSLLFFAFLAINDLEVVLESMIGPLVYRVLFALTGPTILLSVGCIFVISGIRKLSSPDA
ncbi:MAG: hypothetical protein ACTSV9_02430 [Candidatus Thorarchaeota archaeon]